MTTNKVAVVTGSNKGIGLAIVRSLCKKYEGHVYLTSRNEERGKEAIKLLESEGLSPKFHQLDIDDKASIEKLRDYMVSAYNGVDVLINNAGIAFKGADTTPFGTQAEVTIRTNYFSTLDASNILVPIVKSSGRVVNVSSMTSASNIKKCSPELQQLFRSTTITEDQLSEKMNEFIKCAKEGTHQNAGYPNTAYGVSKIGVTVMTFIHARRLKEQGKNDILLNCCCPGWVRTDMAGPKAPKTPDEGAETPVYLALLPQGSAGPHGKYLSDKTVHEW